MSLERAKIVRETLERRAQSSGEALNRSLGVLARLFE